jgi:hypothetical protein
MAHSYSAQYDRRIAVDGGAQIERLALRWAIPAIIGLTLLGWGVVLAPAYMLLHH